MNINKNFELRERATKILGLDRIYNKKDARSSYIRQIKMIHPDLTIGKVEDIPNDELTMLVIQSYNYLVNNKGPTTMIEDDKIIFKLIGERTPFKEILERSKWDPNNFYDDFSNSIWPTNDDDESFKYKFGGIC